MKPVHEEISDLLAERQEDRFLCPKEARKKAMDFLARREYGQIELVKKLADKGFNYGIAEQAITQLTDEGLQSDYRFAESFVQSRVSQGKGPVRIRTELKQRGVDPGLIEGALEASATDWYQLARAIRQKKFGDDAAPDFKARARQMRFLQYRGFEPDHIQAAVVTGDD
ncbi:MAG: regulatory protein RecX [Woeseiaceae bacterium]|nr:regulatory protein RecX [Woeseiaceae bacterium]